MYLYHELFVADFLEVGNGNLSEAENRAHFSLWCVTSAPLIAGNDIRNMTKVRQDNDIGRIPKCSINCYNVEARNFIGCNFYILYFCPIHIRY